MVKRADVLVENFAPGVMERLGLGDEALHPVNPRLVYAPSSGYGRTGPYRDYPAMDLTVQAMAGVMDITGFPDRAAGEGRPRDVRLLRRRAPLRRHRHGAARARAHRRGRTVEVSMLEAVYASLASNLGLLSAPAARMPLRTGNRHGGLAVSRTTSIRPPTATSRSSRQRAALAGPADAMGRADLPPIRASQTSSARRATWTSIDELVSGFTRGYNKHRLFELLMKHRVPCAPVRTLNEVVNDPHLHQRGTLQWIDHPEYGRIVVPSSPMRFDGAPPLAHRAEQQLGADNEGHAVAGSACPRTRSRASRKKESI